MTNKPVYVDQSPIQKPGWQTSELYVTCGAQVVAFITAMSSRDTTAKVMTGLIAAMSLASYFWMRYQFKMAQATTPASSRHVPNLP